MRGKVTEKFQRHFYIGSKVKEKSYKVKKAGKKEQNYKKEML
jgi:hypothetical protein